MYLVKFQIKNAGFPYGKFGLTGPSFLMDIDKTISYSKNIQTTSQPVLDETTRTFHVSREPGTISISGIIGDLRVGGNEKEDAYIKPTVTRVSSRKEKMTIGKSRLQLQRELIAYLRDNAIFLDIYVQNETAIHRDYIIKNVSENASDFGKLDISITLEEVLMFEFPEESKIGSSYVGDDSTLTTQSIESSVDFKLGGVTEAHVRGAIAFMINKLKNLEGAVYIVGNSPNTAAYRPHTFINVVSIVASRTYSNIDVPMNSNDFSKMLNVYVETNSNEYVYKTNNKNIIFKTFLNIEYMNWQGGHGPSGIYWVNGEFKIKIETVTDKNGLEEELHKITFIDDFLVPPAVVNLKKNRSEFSSLANKNYQGSEFNDGGSFFTGSNIKLNPIDEPLEKGWCFLRKKKKSTKYFALPNLLGNSNTSTKGYLYNASFVTYGNRLDATEISGGDYQLYPSFIWISPPVWEEIKKQMKAAQASNSSFELDVASLP